jgi:DNA-binding transcriptional ArsR family regulator
MDTEMEADLKKLATQQSELYKIFSNATRLEILWVLSEGELSVGEIATQAETTLQNTSQHLHRMLAKGLLASRRDAQTIYYRIVDDENVRRYLPSVPLPLPDEK